MITPNTSPDQTIEQDDGAKWAVYYDSNHLEGFTIVTSSGQEILNGPELPELRGLIHRYRMAELGSIALLGEDPEMRDELGRGQEATVYQMGPYAVREKMGIPGFYVALGELQRMDAINYVIEDGLPRWLKIPNHFALHAAPSVQKTYTLMERIDSGLTVEDIENYPDVSDKKTALIEEELGADIEDAQENVPQLYDEAHRVLSEAIERSGRNPAHYLTDWKPRNALVEGKLATPIAGSNYRISVIDQYRQ